MKKRLLTLFAIFMTMIFFTSISCEPEKPLCVQNNFGKVTIYNNTSIFLWVDVTQDGQNYNQEVRLSPGSSHTYTMTPDLLTVWAASDEGRAIDSWNYDDFWMDQCDILDYTWTNKKGMQEGEHSFIENNPNGKSKKTK